jgi:beta-glucosidase-like glycosyl hydrolase
MSGSAGGRAGSAAEVLRARVSRLVCVHIREHRGADENELVAERERYPWGGYAFFGGELEAVRSLIARLRAASPESLLFASDLERGLGQQLAGATSFPPAMALGAAADGALAREVGRATAREAAAVGLNCVFAPVLDLANEPANPIVCTRSFGDDPEVVGELGAELVRGLHEGDVLATAKHFPGHGRTRLDSHETLPVVGTRRAELLATDLVPFRRAIEAGVALVMSAHVAYPELEGTSSAGKPLPATLSRAILTGLLRGELGFEGLVVSDALIMGALAGEDMGGLAARALEAGIDCLLYPPEPRALVDSVVRRVEEGALSAEVIERALHRLDAALGRLPEPAGGGGIGSAEAAELARRAASAGIVTVGEALPSRAAGRSLVLLLLDGAIRREDVVLPALAAAPGREFRWAIPAEEAVAPPQDLGEFEEVSLAYFSPIRAWKGRAGFSPEAADLARALFEARPDVRLISFSSPFILRSLPAVRAAILAFGETAVCQAAVGDVLTGRETPRGRLPIRL